MTDATEQPNEIHRQSDRFVSNVRRCARRVLGDCPEGQQIANLCDIFETERAAIHRARVPDAIIIGVVGPTGQGKSWLIRQFIQAEAAQNALPSGDRTSDATSRIAWIGPYPPPDLDPTSERYVASERDDLIPLGVDYLLLDTPGATDCDPQIAEIARQTLSLASVQLLVVRRDQLRTHDIQDLAVGSEGTLVVPVINVVRGRDEKLSEDIDAFRQAISKTAPTSEILDAVIVDDFDIIDDQPTVSQRTIESIRQLLRPRLVEAGGAERRQYARLAAADRRFRQSLGTLLREELPHLTRAVNQLHEAADQLPVDVAHSLVGSHGSLRAGVRSRLRLNLLSETAALWFPYKSVLGLLCLTHGAWDRLFMSLTGSLPSLITSAVSSVKNLGDIRSFELDMQNGLRQRSAALVRDRLDPLIHRFQQEVGTEQSDAHHQPVAATASMRGIDELQQRSQEIVDDEVQRSSPSRSRIQFMGIAGAMIFWLLLAGPIVSLYGSYFSVCFHALTGSGATLESFPAPRWSMLLTSLLLSLLPTAVYAMVVMTNVQRNSTVERCINNIQGRHSEEITRLQQSGILRLEFDDPVLADAEFLIKAGA